jgi:hypothetical protein
LLYTNSELSEIEIKKAIPLVIIIKNKISTNKFIPRCNRSVQRKLYKTSMKETEEDTKKWTKILKA